MKKSILAAILLLSISTTYAQLNLGIKAGYTSSLGLGSLASAAGGGYDLKDASSELSNNFHAGVFARVGMLGFYFQPELLYAMGKNNYEITFEDVNTKAMVEYDKIVTVSTVDIPLLLGYKILDLKVISARIYAGPKLRFNAGSSLAFENVVAGGSGITEGSLKKDVKSAQVGLEAGFGVDVLMFTLDARYNLIGDMYTTKVGTSTLDNIPVSTFVISVGYKLL